MTKSISNQERAEVRRAERLLEQLELEIAKLKSRDAEMQNLGQTEDPFDFIQVTLSAICSSVESFDITL